MFADGEQLQFLITAFLLTVSVILHHYALAMMQSKNQTLFNIAVLGGFMPAVFTFHTRVWMIAQKRSDLLSEDDFPTKGGICCDTFNIVLVLLAFVGMLVGISHQQSTAKDYLGLTLGLVSAICGGCGLA